MTIHTTIFTLSSQGQQGMCRDRKQNYARTFFFYSNFFYHNTCPLKPYNLKKHGVWTGNISVLYNVCQRIHSKRKTSYPEPNFRHFLQTIGVGSETSAKLPDLSYINLKLCSYIFLEGLSKNLNSCVNFKCRISYKLAECSRRTRYHDLTMNLVRYLVFFFAGTQ
jgi:hypothetical protein